LAIDNQARELLHLIILEINGVLKKLISKNDEIEDKNSVLTTEN